MGSKKEENPMNTKTEAYIRYIKNIKHYADNTCYAYEQDLNRFHLFLEEVGVEDYNRVNDTLINSYILKLEKQKFSPATIIRTVVVLRKFFLYLLIQRIINVDPTENVKGPKPVHQTPTLLTVEEINALINLPDTTTRIGLRDKAIFELLYGTGIKASELIILTLSDVNFHYNILTCHNSKRERIIPFGGQAKVALEKYVKESRNTFLTKGINDTLFLSQQGSGLTRQGFWKIVKGYGKRIGLTNISPQAFRRSFAIHLIENGANVSTVGEMLGYVDTSQAYTYVAAQNMKVREEYMKAHPRAN